jgi:alpha/beta superfamily hydrolase
MKEGDRLADTVREFPGPSGPLEALLNEPPGHARAVVVFAHPLPIEGGTMHTKVVFQSAKALTRIGCAVVRFNFRGVGLSAGTWDEGRGERDDFRAALDFAAARYPGLQTWAAGFSFGSHIAMTVGAGDDRVCTLIGIAPPVHKYDFSITQASPKPKFLVHGSEDELIPLKAVRECYARMAEPKELVEIDRANHLFDGQAAEVGEALEELLQDFSCAAP